MHITRKKARWALKKVVTIRGADYVYSRHGQRCAYSSPAGMDLYSTVPVIGCGVGAALYLLGVNLVQLREMDRCIGSTGIADVPIPNSTITNKARRYLQAFQAAQDAGDTWGDAWMKAEETRYEN